MPKLFSCPANLTHPVLLSSSLIGLFKVPRSSTWGLLIVTSANKGGASHKKEPTILDEKKMRTKTTPHPESMMNSCSNQSTPFFPSLKRERSGL